MRRSGLCPSPLSTCFLTSIRQLCEARVHILGSHKNGVWRCSTPQAQQKNLVLAKASVKALPHIKNFLHLLFREGKSSPRLGNYPSSAALF